MSILTLNAGSSSLKFAVFEPADGGMTRLMGGNVSSIGAAARLDVDATGIGRPLRPSLDRDVASHADALTAVWDLVGRVIGHQTLAAVGHRIVHGGGEFNQPTLLSQEATDRLATFEPLAPLHQPHGLAAVRTLRQVAPRLPQVGCFDTAFHASMPDVATELGLPKSLREEGLRRYGFHGLSYESVVSRFEAVTGQPLSSRVVIAHLGNGASMCAIAKGKSIATTMGFSTIDGLPMGTRCGAVDPGVLIHLMRTKGADATVLEELLYDESGLLGRSGISSDMKTLLESDLPDAARAVDYFCYRAVRELGSLTAVLGGIDALIFTGGIGENAAPVRQRIIADSTWLGFHLDETANCAGEALVTRPGLTPQAWVIPSDEESHIAALTNNVLAEARQA